MSARAQRRCTPSGGYEPQAKSQVSATPSLRESKPLSHHVQKTRLLDAQNLGSIDMNPKQSLRSLVSGLDACSAACLTLPECCWLTDDRCG